MEPKIREFLLKHPLTLKAIDASGISFDDLVDNFSLTLGDPNFPDTWCISFPSSMLPHKPQKLRAQLIGSIHPFIVLVWYFSQASHDERFKLYRINATKYLQIEEMQVLPKLRGKTNIEKRHNKKGGSRDKRKQIREKWSTGKYSSRDICAEQECAGLGMSYSTARKALINTPDPKSKK